MSTKQYTTSEIAEITGKNPSRIRQLAIAHNIGVCHNRYFRLFTPADLRRIQGIFAKIGRRSKNSKSAVDR